MKTRLLRRERRAVKIALGVKNRQQRQPNAGLLRRRHQPHGHLRPVVIRRSVWLMMKIMEFSNGGVAGFKHFNIKRGCDRRKIVRANLLYEIIHRIAPGPEIILAGSHALAEARHRPLKCMAMQVRRAGDGNFAIKSAPLNGRFR